MHSWRDVTFLIVGVWFGVLLSLGQSRGMTRFVSGCLVLVLLFLLLSLRPSPCLTGREKEQTGSAALLPASTFT